MPAFLTQRFNDTGTAIPGRITGPDECPRTARTRGEQGLGRRHASEIGTQIHDQETIVFVLAEVSKHERLGTDHRAVDSSASLRADDRVFPSQS